MSMLADDVAYERGYVDGGRACRTVHKIYVYRQIMSDGQNWNTLYTLPDPV